MPDLTERINRLKEWDSVSASLLSEAAETLTAGELPPGCYSAEEDTVKKWLNEQDSPPTVAILPAPSSCAQIQAFIDLLPSGSLLFIMERQRENALALFKSIPAEDLVASKRIRLGLGENEEVIDYQILTVLNMPACPTISIFTANIEASSDAEFYKSMLMKVRDRVRMKAFNLATVTNLGPTWQYNTLKNLRTICTSPGIKHLNGIFRNKPAIIAAAGPSLDEAIPYLKEIANRFVLIAVGTSLKPLLKNGITPDIVVTVDASYKVEKQFDFPCDDIFIASSCITNPDVMHRFKQTFVGHIDANSIAKWISSRIDDKGTILAGGTVTATAIHLAVQMCCYPILTTGMDLCMAKDGTSHASSTMYHGQVIRQDNLIPVPGNYTPTVYTTPQIKTYIEAVTEMLKHYPSALFINTSTIGARIDGMELDLPEHIARYAAANPINARDTISAIYNKNRIHDTDKLLNEIRQWQSALAEIYTVSLEAAQLCNSLIITMKNPALSGTAEIMEKLGKLKEIDSQIMENEYTAIIEMSLRPAFYDMGADITIQSELENGSIESIRRSRSLFQQIAGASKWTGELLEHTISELTFDQTNQLNETTRLRMSA